MTVCGTTRHDPEVHFQTDREVAGLVFSVQWVPIPFCEERLVSQRMMVCVLSVCWLALSTTAMAETTLQATFKKGEVQKQKMTQKQSMVMQLPGQPAAKTEINQIMEMELTCDEVSAAGVATLRQRLPRVRMTMVMPAPLNKKLEYDTNEPAPTDPILQQIDKMMRPMIGVDWSMKCDSRGQISDVVLPPKALDGLKGSPAAAFGGEMFSEAGLKQIAEQSGISLPDKPIKPGDKWTVPTEIKSPIGKMKMQREHTYLGPGDKSGTEKIELRVKIDLEADPNSKLPLMVKLKSGSGSGDILFDNQLGRIARSRVKTTMEMEIGAGAQTFQQSVIAEVTVEDVSAE